MEPIQSPVTDQTFLKTFTGGKEDKIKKYIGMFLDGAPGLLKQIDDHLASGDLALLRVAAHSLKPQLTYMGVKEEASHIYLIEKTAAEAAHAERLPELIARLHQVCDQAFVELRALM